MKKPALLPLDTILSKAKRITYPLRGIYFIIEGGQITYVGQTPNVYRRLGHHLSRLPRERFFFLPQAKEDVSNEELTLLERRYIDKFSPPLNIQKGFHENIESKGVERATGATKRAIQLVEQGHTPYSAAKREGIALSTIYNALKRRRERNGQP